jgi:fatty aldehyde-generating acyl-ACP reductase
MKTTFAFLTHPVNLQQVKMFYPATRFVPDSLIRFVLKGSSFKIIPLKKLKDRQGNEIDGYIIMSPILPEDIKKQDDETIFAKIVEAGALCGKLGFKILGLGGYYSAVADKKSMLYKHLKVPVTTGSVFTAWCIFEGAFKATRKNRMDMRQQTVTILSPINPIGLLCARKFADTAGRIILSGDQTGRLEKVRQDIRAESAITVDIENDLTKAVQEASIIVNADPLHTLFDLERIRPNTIVCDVSIFENIRNKAKKRTDITAVDSTLISTPFNGHMGAYPAQPYRTVSPGLAETMLLTLRGNFVNYSLGENIHLDKMDYIANIASCSGFEVMMPGSEIT